MADTWFADLRLTRLTAVMAPERPWVMPPEAAVTLRGAFGLAIREVACTTGHGACEACAMARDCLVPGWFEPGGDRLRPFALRVAGPAGELVSAERPLRATWTFFGPIPRPSLVVEAIHRMARVGLGALRVPQHLLKLVVEGQGAPVVLPDDASTVLWPEPAALSRFVRVPGEFHEARVHLVTRLDFGRALDRQPLPSDLLWAAVRRVRGVARSLGVRLDRRWPDPAEAGGAWLQLEWGDASRWSRRQEQEVHLDGWRGSARFGPEAAPFADLLAAAEVLQLGGHTTAGLGVVAVEWG